MTMDAASIWDRPRIKAGELLPVEHRSFAGIPLTAQRRVLHFSEEEAIIRAGVDPKTKQVNLRAMLRAYVAHGGVAASSFGITPARVDEIDADPDLLWFLASWLLADILARFEAGGVDGARKKSGTPSTGGRRNRTSTTRSTAPGSVESASATNASTP